MQRHEYIIIVEKKIEIIKEYAKLLNLTLVGSKFYISPSIVHGELVWFALINTRRKQDVFNDIYKSCDLATTKPCSWLLAIYKTGKDNEV